MALAPGTRIGLYEIVGSLGAGGMGEVYRARDGRLERDVALKILPELFAADPDRLARFEREAKTLAALNHPHIAQIHGIEESAGIRALVMELVEGETLAERIARGPIPLDEAPSLPTGAPSPTWTATACGCATSPRSNRGRCLAPIWPACRRGRPMAVRWRFSSRHAGRRPAL